MTIQRIGTTEGLKDVYGVHALPIISLAVVHNGIVSTCGVTAEPSGDVRVQTKKVLETIDRLLQQAGTDKSKLLTANVWLADWKDFEDHNCVGTSGLTDKIRQFAFASRLPSGGQACWLKSW